MPDKDGNTFRQHVQSLVTQNIAVDLSGYPEPPKVPYGSDYVWDLFWNLREGVGGNGFSPNPISYQELDAYSRLMGIRLSLFMVKAIRHMDNRYLGTLAKQASK